MVSQTLIVLDGTQRSALAATRSLGRRGFNVIVGSETGHCLAAASRFAKGSIQLPDARTAPAAFRRAVELARDTHDAVAIIPCTEPSILALRDPDEDPEASATSSLPLPLPERAALGKAMDKGWVAGRAQELGIPVPPTRLFDTGTQLLEHHNEITLPCVIRPTKSWRMINGELTSGGACIARTAAELRAHCLTDPMMAHHPIMVQDYVEGHGAGVFLCYDQGRQVAEFAHRRLREKPPSGGVSVLSESIGVDPRMKDYASRLLADLGWHSVAMVEFRIGLDGTPYIMEINPRLWGTTQLAVDAGIDFPWMMAAMTSGIAYDRCEDFRKGVRLRWLLGDVDRLYLRLRDGSGMGDRFGALLEFLAPKRRTRHEINRIEDLGPALVELRNWIARR